MIVPKDLGAARSMLHLLRALVDELPDHPLVRWRDDGTVGQMTASQLHLQAQRYAGGLQSLGVAPGDRVAVALPNSTDCVILWFAVAMAGAVEVPVNVELRGPMLAHVLTDSDPRIVLVAAELVDAVLGSGYERTEILHAWDADLRRDFAESAPLDPADPAADDLSTIMYTSGTTGPSKGAKLTHGYFTNVALTIDSMNPGMGGGDVCYLCNPMFHVDGRCLLAAALYRRATFAWAPRFSASQFWDDMRDFGVTFFFFVGAMLSVLAKTSSKDDTVGHRLRAATGAPIPPEAYEFFEDGLGVKLLEVYGMTEANGVTWSTPEKRRRGSAGWEAGPYEVRIGAPNDELLGSGEVGEILVRPVAPNLMTLGYWNRDEATVESFRNLWFHTGDLGRYDEDGFLWFVGRNRDMIRRRGENISAYELEMTLSRFPGVLECAAVPVPGDLGGEEEVMVYLTTVNGQPLDLEALAQYAAANLAHFAVPRYMEVVNELPHTPTGKVAKHELPASPSATTWDGHQNEG